MRWQKRWTEVHGTEKSIHFQVKVFHGSAFCLQGLEWISYKKSLKIISSKFQVDEIGYVKKDQSRTVKLVGKNNSMYDSIEGKVTTISPDAIYSDNNTEEPYFEIRIETNKNYFQGKTEIFYMYPGTQVLALINIGKRTISNYLLEPIFANFTSALTER